MANRGTFLTQLLNGKYDLHVGIIVIIFFLIILAIVIWAIITLIRRRGEGFRETPNQLNKQGKDIITDSSIYFEGPDTQHGMLTKNKF